MAFSSFFMRNQKLILAMSSLFKHRLSARLGTKDLILYFQNDANTCSVKAMSAKATQPHRSHRKGKTWFAISESQIFDP